MELSKRQFSEMLDRYLSNTASPEERQLLDRFFDSYRPGPGDRLEDDSSLPQDMLEMIQSRVQQRTEKGKSRRVALLLPIAAVISLFVVAFFFWKEMEISPEAPATLSRIEQNSLPGERSQFRLPDGSVVHLNGDSKISYLEGFGESLREITLTGEAYFEVVKGEVPFVVHAASMRTEVLGTSFNVKNRSGRDVEVTLVEGSVHLFGPSGSSSVLQPNQRAVVDLSTGRIDASEVNTLRFTSWKDNILFFEETHLDEAIETLERWYAVEIDVINPALARCVINAKYQNEPLGNVLSSFQFLLDLQVVRIEKGHYSINGKGC